jgi:hypothetical protein
MAYKIQIRRDTATNWTSVNPTLGQGELGYETTTGKLKVGDGVKTWTQLDYLIGENDGSIDLGAVDKHVLPATDNVYDLGSPTKQWRDLYVSNGSIYVGDIKISNEAGRLIFTQVTNPGQINEAPVPGGTEAFELPVASNTLLGAVKIGDNLTIEEDGTLNAQQGDYELPTASNVVKGGILIGDNLTIDGEGYLSATVPDVSNFITAEDIPAIPADISDLTDTEGLLDVGGLPTVTVPGETGTTYKGLQVSYGRIHSNSNLNELNVNKIVIHKPAVTTTTIDPTSSQDDFQVSGIGTSDVVAMFVVYGDVNGAKPLSDLQAFAESVIDLVILDGGVAGEYNTVDAMKAAFYDIYPTLALAAGGLFSNFAFFSTNNIFDVNAELTGQGSGTGFRVYSISYNLSNDTLSLNGYDIGSGYTQGDVVTIPGTAISYNGTALVSPDNDVAITITEVNEFGQPMVFALTGTLPRPENIWPENSISDGGRDQYDTANYISTNLANNINYNSGETVEDGVAAFGAGSTYSFVYDTGIFGLFATGSSATLIKTSGNSGADGNSTTEAGNIYGPSTAAQVFDNAVTHINLVGTPYASPLITFTRTDYGDEVDEISEGLHITKNDQGWLYNLLEDEGHDDNTPTGSLWNNDGWDDFGNIESRTYATLESIWGGNFANIPGAKMIMLDTTTGKYWAIEFLSWTNNQQGGGASYTRQELNLNSLEVGIRFSDGTRQTTAYVATNVKLTATGNRRIEEVAGYKQVEVTAKSTVNLTGTASRNSEGQAIIWIDINTTTIDEILSDTTAAGITDNSTVQFSVDNTNWYVFDGGTSFTSSERGYSINLNGATLTYNQGDTIYFRYQTGGAPQVWWDSDDLPSGSSGFRGAVIDYHAYIPGEGTIVGTIHTVDDDGDRNITHTEVSSGSSDLENADLWNQAGEGEIRYRRIDGESSTLKIQWTAKVFYGSEYYDD